MYPIKDKKAAVKEIQRYLITISQVEYALPHVTADGFFGDQTRAAVTEFQKISGLTPSGAVDFETFNAIYRKQLEILQARDREKSVYLAQDYPLKRGDNNESVQMLNAALRILYGYYEIKKPRDDGYFSADTLAGVIYFKKVFGLKEDGYADIEFMKRLSDEILARQKFVKPL